jgi:hypothetical protein
MVHLPKALEVLAGLLDSDDERVRLAAAIEVCDRTIGKPKPVDVDIRGPDPAVTSYTEAFALLKERVDTDELVLVERSSLPQDHPAWSST